jgi:magnesium-transporting ATPase (P-type)
MILADDNFATIVTAVREGRVVWDNLRKVLLINTPINNAQGMSVLFGLAFGLERSPLSPIQVLYSNLICAITLGFISAIEPAEEGIMGNPPRRIGKRLIGRYLLLRILLGTLTLTTLVVLSAFILIGINGSSTVMTIDMLEKAGIPEAEWPTYVQEDIRALAFNVLDFGAIGVTLSARFNYLNSIHPRVFYGNKYCWYSVFIVAGLQVFLTQTPGVNRIIFQMRGMDGLQWGISLAFMVAVFIVMEAEKALRRYLKAQGADTDDTKIGAFDNPNEGEVDTEGRLLPKGASSLNLVALEK